MQTSVPLPIAAVIGFVGSALCVWGFFAAWREERRFLGTAVRTTGVVESLVRGPGPRAGEFPVVRFTTANGASVSAVSKSTRFGYWAGQKVRIDYDPDDPSQMEIHSWWSHWAALGLLALFALLLLWIGVNAVEQLAAR
jgi:hypothetical protein